MPARPYPTAEDAYAAIRRALADGNPMLADAIDNDERCPDCGGYVSAGMSVDPDHCCFFCSP
jgi:hypothetical protein